MAADVDICDYQLIGNYQLVITWLLTEFENEEPMNENWLSCSYILTAQMKELSLPFCLFVCSKHDHHCQIVNILCSCIFDFSMVPIAFFFFFKEVGIWESCSGCQGEVEKLWGLYWRVQEETGGAFQMLLRIELKYLGPASSGPGACSWWFWFPQAYYSYQLPLLPTLAEYLLEVLGILLEGGREELVSDAQFINNKEIQKSTSNSNSSLV